MKKSEFHQIIGCLIEANEIDLAKKVTASVETDIVSHLVNKIGLTEVNRNIKQGKTHIELNGKMSQYDNTAKFLRGEGFSEYSLVKSKRRQSKWVKGKITVIINNSKANFKATVIT